MTGRRQFLWSATSNLAAMAALGAVPAHPSYPAADEWDLAWPERLKGKRRAVFDAGEIDGGHPVFRAAIWTNQCVAILGASRADVSPVIVLRGHAVALALTQAFWDKYSVGHVAGVTHPVTGKELSRNPALMEDGLPPPMLAGGLLKQLAAGVTVLACNVALQIWIDVIRQRSGVSDAEARKEAVGALVPGVILQPSGVLAAYLAQEHGCQYISAS